MRGSLLSVLHKRMCAIRISGHVRLLFAHYGLLCAVGAAAKERKFWQIIILLFHNLSYIIIMTGSRAFLQG